VLPALLLFCFSAFLLVCFPIIGTIKTVPCIAGPDTNERAMVLVLDPEYFITCANVPEAPNTGIVSVAICARAQESFIDRQNAHVLHVTLNCKVRPHPTCARIKGASRVLWTMQLRFQNSASCTAVFQHLRRIRTVVRKSRLAMLVKMLPDPMSRMTSRNLSWDDADGKLPPDDLARADLLAAGADSTTPPTAQDTTSASDDLSRDGDIANADNAPHVDGQN
jgi:hypothetical protein